MDPLHTATTFLLIRLGCPVTESQVSQAFQELFLTRERASVMPLLMNRLSKVIVLEPSCRSWLGTEPLDPLSPDEIYTIFSHAQIFNFALKLKTDRAKVDKALCELIPFMVRRYHTFPIKRLEEETYESSKN